MGNGIGSSFFEPRTEKENKNLPIKKHKIPAGTFQKIKKSNKSDKQKAIKARETERAAPRYGNRSKKRNMLSL